MRTIGLLIGLLVFASAAHAQSRNCGPRDKVVETLAQKYKETRRSIGLATQGRVMEVYASDETGTWTVVVTMPNGITCLIASGQAYEAVEEELEPAGLRL